MEWKGYMMFLRITEWRDIYINCIQYFIMMVAIGELFGTFMSQIAVFVYKGGDELCTGGEEDGVLEDLDVAIGEVVGVGVGFIDLE